ncbi:MAG: lipoyl(octanoyl) transferase LipB [Theionarchaea archaeon]|nr:lipoyl(octanoyl) transferase LipB [Theionarchaea archaeon]
MVETAVWFDLGLTEYMHVYDLQKRLAFWVARGKCPQSLLLLEHEPVYTVGKSGSKNQLPGICALEVDRGGGVTYHGPGQLIGYPILRLGSRRVSTYIRTLEESLILLLEKYGITASIKEGYPGVWVGPEKIASIGVRVRNMVTYHGFALNITTDLEPFNRINPCGLDISMTSVKEQIHQDIPMDQVKAAYEKVFEQCFDLILEQGNTAHLEQKAHSHFLL